MDNLNCDFMTEITIIQLENHDIIEIVKPADVDKLIHAIEQAKDFIDQDTADVYQDLLKMKTQGEAIAVIKKIEPFQIWENKTK